MAGIREYFYSLMTDRGRGPASGGLKFILWVCSLFYGLAVRLISTGYQKGFFVSYHPDPKVISVGNITVGGTGKTQAVIALARQLESLGKRPAILIRGYGADEHKMLQEELKDIPVLVGPDRIANSKRAFFDFGADIIILDDGYQHWKIERDLDIVLVDATNPFGNQELIPRGILREPISALGRADLIIITKVDSGISRIEELYAVIEKLGKADYVLESVYRPQDLYEISSEHGMGLEAIQKRKVCLVSSIANPVYFKQNLINLGADIALEFTFLDHYEYKKRDLYRIGRECKLFGAEFIVTTQKDAVKIRRLALQAELSIPLLVLEVEFAVTKNKKLLDDRLLRMCSS